MGNFPQADRTASRPSPLGQPACALQQEVLEAAVNARPSVLCPIDYSRASAGALQYAAAIAEHFVTRLIVLVVESPTATIAADLGTVTCARDGCEETVAAFVAQTFSADAAARRLCEDDVAVGEPATEILRVARERSCDLIVMSAHGADGDRQGVLGSTTARVLRDATIPVLVTPSCGSRSGPRRPD